MPAAARGLGEQLADVAGGGVGVVENDRLYAHPRILRTGGYVVGSTLVVPNAYARPVRASITVTRQVPALGKTTRAR